LFPQEFWDEVTNQVNNKIQKAKGKTNERYKDVFYPVNVRMFLLNLGD
jgi:hypothetical protein